MAVQNPAPKKPVRIIGIDASLRSTGIGVVEQKGGRLCCTTWTTLRNSRSLPHSQCLKRLHEQLASCIGEVQPSAAALESGFYLKNARTAMVLGEVRGVAIATCAAHDIPVYEYAPRRVKQALVGTGSAAKQQVARMVVSLLGLKETPQEDAADALAIAICHIHSRTGQVALDPQPL